jgi:hypothetical protein
VRPQAHGADNRARLVSDLARPAGWKDCTKLPRKTVSARRSAERRFRFNVPTVSPEHIFEIERRRGIGWIALHQDGVEALGLGNVPVPSAAHCSSEVLPIIYQSGRADPSRCSAGSKDPTAYRSRRCNRGCRRVHPRSGSQGRAAAGRHARSAAAE